MVPRGAGRAASAERSEVQGKQRAIRSPEAQSTSKGDTDSGGGGGGALVPAGAGETGGMPEDDEEPESLGEPAGDEEPCGREQFLKMH